MSSRFQENMAVRDAARKHPHGASVLLWLGIAPDDTCTLAEAGSKGHIPTELLTAALDETVSAARLPSQIDDNRLQAALRGVIIAYVVERYHGP